MSSTFRRMILFNTKPHDKEYFTAHQEDYGSIGVSLTFHDKKLSLQTVEVAAGHEIVCAFVNDDLSRPVILKLKELGCQMIALRCAGYNHVDLATCNEVGIVVARVPAYSPYAVAELAVSLMMCLNRNLHLAYENTRNGDFKLHKRLIGFDMNGKTVGILGTGKIGRITAKICLGFGCKVICHDLFENEELKATPGVKYVDLDTFYAQSDVISVHVPLTGDNHHMINAASFDKMRDGVMIINTSRGGLINSEDLINALLRGKVSAAGLDVYEHEQAYFFEDWHRKPIQDATLARLLSFPNVICTAHQAFFTREALTEIARVTCLNVTEFLSGKPARELTNVVVHSKY